MTECMLCIEVAGCKRIELSNVYVEGSNVSRVANMGEQYVSC